MMEQEHQQEQATTQSTSTMLQAAERSFSTPSREEHPEPPPSNLLSQKTTATPEGAGISTVTPSESSLRSSNNEPQHVHDKHVQFGRSDPTRTLPAASTSTSSSANSSSNSATAKSGSKRGLVSRRGGRMGGVTSPTRAIAAAHATSTADNTATVLEYKTYRSPQRPSNKETAPENDTIPSLCSTNSGISSHGLESGKTTEQHPPQQVVTPGSTSTKEEERAEGAVDTGRHMAATATATTSTATTSTTDDEHRRPSSISLDASLIDTTSPLASHDLEASPVKRSTRIANKKLAQHQRQQDQEEKQKDEEPVNKRNVTFSPPPPPSEPMRMDSASTKKSTPSKSPSAGRFHTLPSLQEAKLSSSPGAGMFLSPHPPSPTHSSTLKPFPSFDTADDVNQSGMSGEVAIPKRSETAHRTAPEEARDQERDRAVATPTDFALDFGRGHQPSASFDASNVLAWLQSPTTNGMFSPGGLGSVANTPRGGGLQAPRTPRTPTTTTSFFFSDVASLPRNTDFPTSPSRDTARRGGGSYSSSMICISPLASRRTGVSRSTGNTPMNSYKDVFPSPQHYGDRSNPRGLPLLGDSPKTKGRSKTGSSSSHRDHGNLESVHLAERDLMEDEDLSVLLQLASHSTPKSARDAGTGSHVFRSGGQRGSNKEEASSTNLPGLQLPVIGGRMDGGGAATKLMARKAPASSKDPSANDFRPPPLSIRSSTSSGGSKEIYFGSAKPPLPPQQQKQKDDGGGKQKSKDTEKRKGTKAGSGSGKTSGKATGTENTTYSMPGAHPPYPHGGPEPPPYYPLPGQMPSMPPGGSMRVVVGGPPPPMVSGGRPGQSSSSGSSQRHPGQGSPHRPSPYGDSRYGGPPHYPPPMYPPHPMGGMPPHYGYPPHPGHMPMYASQHAPSKGMPPSKKGKGQKKGSKRPPAADGGKEATAANKKAKKSPNKTRRKKASPPEEAPVDRQKAAAAIQAVNAASGGNNDKAAALAAAIMRGVTMRPSGKWQAQLYYAGKSRYIGVFDTREKAALAYEIAREKLKDSRTPSDQSAQSIKATEAAVNLARKAAFEGVNEKDRMPANK